MQSLASRESTFQLQKESSLGGGPGFSSTEPDWTSSDLIMIDIKAAIIILLVKILNSNLIGGEQTILIDLKHFLRKCIASNPVIWDIIIMKSDTKTKASLILSTIKHTKL